MAIDTSSVSSTVLSQYSGTDTSSSDSSSLGKTDFMMLLVTQLNNQNPLDPQDNSEFVAQLAQFAILESMENLNASMTSLLSTYQSSQALQATSLVGSSVIVETGSALVDTSESLSGTVVMPSSGSNVNVKIYDSTGSLVKTISLGDQSSGNVDFIWDGTNSSGETVDPGTFTFVAEASLDGTTTALSTYLPAKVNSVTLGQDGAEMTLNLAGIGSVGLSQVRTVGK
ncbi:flagellar hook assembly protein FlgD [Stutzerimonas balearica]|uniref:flagellar hook assembly protein FlgD n=1 Tax=Stutzerimonas balearica TaxID=74829 RepID=UPI001BAE96E1|nr:flagellar hook assembly protein FlgD [Stutzerimonas balearica]WAN11117.1 flagellar hook assembly protein FlgD [Stutzerimonas balearica]